MRSQSLVCLIRFFPNKFLVVVELPFVVSGSCRDARLCASLMSVGCMNVFYHEYPPIVSKLVLSSRIFQILFQSHNLDCALMFIVSSAANGNDARRRINLTPIFFITCKFFDVALSIANDLLLAMERAILLFALQ